MTPWLSYHPIRALHCSAAIKGKIRSRCYDRPVEFRPPAERRPTLRQAPVSSEPIEPEGLTVTALLAALRRRRWVLILCALLFPVVAYIAAKKFTPRYTASTSVLYETDRPTPRVSWRDRAREDTTDAVMASQVEVIPAFRSPGASFASTTLTKVRIRLVGPRRGTRRHLMVPDPRDAVPPAERPSAYRPDVGARSRPSPWRRRLPTRRRRSVRPRQLRNALIVKGWELAGAPIRFTSEDPRLARQRGQHGGGPLHRRPARY